MIFNFLPYSSDGTSTSTHTIPLPASIAAGEIILILYGDNVGAGHPTPTSGYTSLFRDTSTDGRRGGVIGKIADGGETSVVLDWGVDTATVLGATAIRVSGGGPALLSEIEFAFIQNNGFATPINNPGPLTSSITAGNYGWLAFVTGLSSNPFTAGPTGYSGFASVASNDGATANGVLGYAYTQTASATENPDPFTNAEPNFKTLAVTIALPDTSGAAAIPSLRKSSQFTVETTLAGTVTSATLNGAAITVDSHVGTTVTLTDSDGSITTSGEYALVLTDNAAATEAITVQVNVYGVAPSNNPLQKDGAALASLTNVEVRISAGATLAGSQLFYSGTATTDVSGNLGNIDLSSTNAADADPVLLSIRTAAGDSIIASETVGII